ncbi:MAG: STAS domain-containing protein [bacterium]
MEIIKQSNGDTLDITLKGRLDTVTSPQLEEELTDLIPQYNNVNFDFKDLDYISSAGLRVLISTHKKIRARGKLVVKNVSSIVYEIFEVTGLTEVIDVKQNG